MIPKSFLLIIGLLVIGCSNPASSLVSNAEQGKNAHEYLLKLNVTPRNDHTYLVFSSEHCNPCAISILKWLESHRQVMNKFSVVLSGTKFNKDFYLQLAAIEKEIEVIRDSQGWGNRYDIGLVKPLAVMFVHDQCVAHVKLESEDVDRVLTALSID